MLISKVLAMNVLCKLILPCGLLVLAGCSSYPTSQADSYSVVSGMPNHTIEYIQHSDTKLGSQMNVGDTVSLSLQTGEQSFLIEQRYFSAIGTTCFAMRHVASSLKSTQTSQYNLCEYPQGWGIVRAFRN
ncbi:hypothetical protein BZG84_15370 [Salinivibrio sp. PR932]|nr:hypothetical protein BZG84_15370 [Salinivibrio sp. PR932]